MHDIDGWKSLVSQLSTECSAALERGGYGAVKARGWQRWRAASARPQRRRRRRKCHPTRPPARSVQRRSKQAFCLHSQPYYHHKLVQCLDNLRKVPTAARAPAQPPPHCPTAEINQYWKEWSKRTPQTQICITEKWWSNQWNRVFSTLPSTSKKQNVQHSAKYKTLLLQEDDEVAIRWGANEDMRWKIWKMRKYEKKIKDEKMMRINQHL